MDPRHWTLGVLFCFDCLLNYESIWFIFFVLLESTVERILSFKRLWILEEIGYLKGTGILMHLSL